MVAKPQARRSRYLSSPQFPTNFACTGADFCFRLCYTVLSKSPQFAVRSSFLPPNPPPPSLALSRHSDCTYPLSHDVPWPYRTIVWRNSGARLQHSRRSFGWDAATPHRCLLSVPYSNHSSSSTLCPTCALCTTRQTTEAADTVPGQGYGRHQRLACSTARRPRADGAMQHAPLLPRRRPPHISLCPRGRGICLPSRKMLFVTVHSLSGR
ncbi:hypothetical protein LZ30DRAFT_209259 [Colletotrichum cereale]|nr:hypothetical protein LZ30DRAFT_209259 [Colletotrichum cereale]